MQLRSDWYPAALVVGDIWVRDIASLEGVTPLPDERFGDSSSAFGRLPVLHFGALEDARLGEPLKRGTDRFTSATLAGQLRYHRACRGRIDPFCTPALELEDGEPDVR